MFYINLTIQGFFLLVLIFLSVRGRRLAACGPAALFTLLHAFFYYILPQTFLLLSATPRLYLASYEHIVRAQVAVLSFLAIYLVCRIVGERVFGRPDPKPPLSINAGSDPLAMIIIYALSALGILCLFMFAIRLGGLAYRSEGVSTLSGQLIFAGSLLCHFFVVLLAVTWWRSGKRYSAALIIGITSVLFLYLGGRARALFVPLYFVWLLALFRVRLTVARVIVALAAIVAIIPALELLKNVSYAWRTGAPVSSIQGWDTIAQTLVTGNMASSFRSLAQVVGYDGNISGTPGTWFMRTFYAEVYAKGVGFHLGMLGEAYLLAGFAGIIVLGALLGTASCVVDRIFVMSHMAGTRLLCMILCTWSFAIGWNLIDSLLKVMAVMLGPALWASATFIASATSSRRRYARR